MGPGPNSHKWGLAPFFGPIFFRSINISGSVIIRIVTKELERIFSRDAMALKGVCYG
jgi:hypothetical protein